MIAGIIYIYYKISLRGQLSRDQGGIWEASISLYKHIENIYFRDIIGAYRAKIDLRHSGNEYAEHGLDYLRQALICSTDTMIK